MQRILNLRPSTSADYTRLAAEAAAATKLTKENLTNECKTLYNSIVERLSIINCNDISAQNNNVSELSEVKLALKQISRDVSVLAKKHKLLK